MKALILAAGRGTRLSKYVTDRPKGMLVFNDSTIIKRQIENFKECGINDIIVIRGYMADSINYSNVKYYDNKYFATTNMVESLFCAEQEFNDDLIVSYADILFEKKVLKGLIANPGEFNVTVDMNWQHYWKTRYGAINHDIESLSLNKDGSIAELGNDTTTVENIDARYVGLLKFTSKGLEKSARFYHGQKTAYSGKPWKGGRIFEQAYMTDFLQALIDSGEKLNSYRINSGWIEFDTNEDYELMKSMAENNTLNQLITLGN